MFRFEDPIYLWLLLLIPVLVLVRVVMWQLQKRKLSKLGDRSLLELMMPDVSKYRPTVKFALMMLAVVLVILMIARPQMGSRIQKDQRNGIEVMIAMDISNSMKAKDVVPSRLEKSKMLVNSLIDNFDNDKIGLIVFAGDAFVQLPMTSDNVSAKMFLDGIDPSLIGSQGTDIGAALDLAMKSFSQDKAGKAIVLITDGEDHEGGAQEKAKDAYSKGMNVYILGVGSDSGAQIPTGDGGYMQDNSGQTVISRLNEQMCQELAQAGKGQYIHVDNTNMAQERLNKELAKLQKGEGQAVIYSEYADQFQAMGILILLVLIIEICVLEIKNPLLRNVIFIKKRSYSK